LREAIRHLFKPLRDRRGSCGVQRTA